MASLFGRAFNSPPRQFYSAIQRIRTGNSGRYLRRLTSHGLNHGFEEGYVAISEHSTLPPASAMHILLCRTGFTGLVPGHCHRVTLDHRMHGRSGRVLGVDCLAAGGGSSLQSLSVSSSDYGTGYRDGECGNVRDWLANIGKQMFSISHTISHIALARSLACSPTGAWDLRVPSDRAEVAHRMNTHLADDVVRRFSKRVIRRWYYCIKGGVNCFTWEEPDLSSGTSGRGQPA